MLCLLKRLRPSKFYLPVILTAAFCFYFLGGSSYFGGENAKNIIISLAHSVISENDSTNQLTPQSVGHNSGSLDATDKDTFLQKVKNSYGTIPLFFEKNKGQTNPKVKYLSRGKGYNFFLTTEGMVLSITRQKSSTRRENKKASDETAKSDEQSVIRMNFAGALDTRKFSEIDKQLGTSSYFIGGNVSKWQTGVEHFAKIKQESIYEGIDVLYYGNQRELEYDLIISPKVNPNRIRISIEGFDTKYIDSEGNLILNTKSGDVKKAKPIAFQEINGQRVPVECEYTFNNKDELGFKIGSYNEDIQLTIDPVIDYSTFIGGSKDDQISDIAVDSGGNAYIVGSTASTDFPTTTGSYKQGLTGTQDCFVTKINSTGTGIVYSTYIGGAGSRNNSGSSGANSIALDAAGNAYITGSTGSASFPIVNARKSSISGDTDAFLLKLNSSGSTLLFSTYHGGSSSEAGYSIILDSAGNIYTTGTTKSTDFQTVNPYQSTYQGGDFDTYISKFSNDGNSLLYSTYFGGTRVDIPSAISVDSFGNIYTAGSTNSTNFPVQNAVQSTTNEDWLDRDGFITKFNPSGNNIIYSTFLGGSSPNCDPATIGCVSFSSTDEVLDMAVDSVGNAYIVGRANSPDFPVYNAIQPTNGSSYYNRNEPDAFIAKLNPSGGFIFSTYFGGNDYDLGHSIALDSSNNIYITGVTDSSNFRYVNPLSITNISDSRSVFTAKLSTNGNSLIYSSLLGAGSDLYTTTPITVDSQGNAYIAGKTTSSNFPNTGNLQAQLRGAYDGFITKINTSVSGFSLSGKVTTVGGSAAGNVKVLLTGGLITETLTDSGGNFIFRSLAPNKNYIVSPSSASYTFLPTNQTFTNLNANQTANFVIQTYEITGRVADIGGSPLPGTTVNLTGTASKTTQTDANGNYIFSSLIGGNYTVTPSKTDSILSYSFTPPNYSFTNMLADQTADFVATGLIAPQLAPVADAYVQDGSSAGANFGTASFVRSATDTKTNTGKNFDTYLKFDLSGINREILSAKLRVTGATSAAGSVTTSVYPVAAVDWKETGVSSITWNNKPARATNSLTGADMTVSGTTANTYEVDITSYIKNEKAAGRNLVSLALHNPSASAVSATFNSREAADNKPRLVVITRGEENYSPQVEITAPVNGSTFTAPATMSLNATAVDADGVISKVEFYSGTSLIGTATSPTSGSNYSVSWSNVPAGSYALTAIGYDDRGAQTTSSPINITVGAANNLSPVAITIPADNSSFAVGTNVNLTASANDLDGTIAKIEFFAGQTLIGTATAPSSGNLYTVLWNSPSTGSYSVTARSTDNNGGQSVSAPVTINIYSQIGLTPAADAYVQDGSTAATNYGTATELRAQQSPTAGANRETYVKYDLTTVTGITKATVRLYGRLSDISGSNVPVNIYPVVSTTWIESGNSSITWNNRPPAGQSPVSNTVISDNTPRWYEFDVTQYAQSEKNAGRNLISLAIKANSASNPYAVFNSKEAATNQPQLLLQTTQPRNVLMVVGSSTLNVAETAIRTRLQNLGFGVIVKAAGSTTNTSIKAADADGKSLVVVSSTVNPTNVGTKLKNIPVPLINCEAELADDFAMTETVLGTDYGTAASQTQIGITNPNHPLSGGFSGAVTVSGAAATFNWGKPNANADKTASLLSDVNKATIYAYDTGRQMVNLEAPARRVGFFLHDATAASLTNEGNSLFDSAVKWTTDVNALPTISNLSPVIGPIGSNVVINGSNFGLSQTLGNATFSGITAPILNWTNTSITAVVPPGATTGYVVVTVNGVTSNQMTFTVGVASAGDTDGDGLPDAWEMTYFGNLNLGANDDPDGDGVNNLEEFLRGRNPTRGAINLPGVVDLRILKRIEQ